MISIQDPLPIPDNCDNCCSLNIDLITNYKLPGKPKVYICLDCGASTGCHKETVIPFGRMADTETRKLRAKAHLAFDPLWKGGYMSRSRAYTWLALELGIEFNECHLSWLSKSQLKKVISICPEYLSTNRTALLKRKAKKDAREYRRKHKTARRINQRKSCR